MEIGLILLLVLGSVILTVFGWFHSAKSRKLAKFAILIIFLGAAVFLLLVFILRTFFPLPIL